MHKLSAASTFSFALAAKMSSAMDSCRSASSAAMSSLVGANKLPISPRWASVSSSSGFWRRGLVSESASALISTSCNTQMFAFTLREKNRRSCSRAHMASASVAIWAARGSISIPLRFFDKMSSGMSRVR